MSYTPACSRMQPLLGLTHKPSNLLDIFVCMEFCESDNGNGCVVISPRNPLLVCAPSVTSLQACLRAQLIMSYGRYVIASCLNSLFLFSDAFWTAIIRPIGNASLVASPGRTWPLPNVDVVLLWRFLSPTVVSQWVLKLVSCFHLYLGAVWHWTFDRRCPKSGLYCIGDFLYCSC